MNKIQVAGRLLLVFWVYVLCMIAAGCKQELDLSVPGGGVGMLFRVENPKAGGLQAMADVVRERLALTGEKRSKVTALQGDRIVVLLPGASQSDADRIHKLLCQPTRLAFSAVDDDRGFFNDLQSKLPADGSVRLGLEAYRRSEKGERVECAYLMASDRKKLEAFVEMVQPPAGRKLWIMPGKQAAAAYSLVHPPNLDRPTVTEAMAGNDELTGRVDVSITLQEKHRQAFAQLTKQQLHRRLAILVDGEIRSLPVVQSVIQSGRARISPSPVTPDEVTEQEARALAAGIKAWGLAGGLSLVERRITPL